MLPGCRTRRRGSRSLQKWHPWGSWWRRATRQSFSRVGLVHLEVLIQQHYKHIIQVCLVTLCHVTAILHLLYHSNIPHDNLFTYYSQSYANIFCSGLIAALVEPTSPFHHPIFYMAMQSTHTLLSQQGLLIASGVHSLTVSCTNTETARQTIDRQTPTTEQCSRQALMFEHYVEIVKFMLTCQVALWLDIPHTQQVVVF